MVENTVVLRPLREGRTYVFGRVMGGLGGRRLEIRTCFPNPIRATHRNTCPIFQHLADGGNHDREVWPTFGAVHFKNNVLKTYL